MYRCLDSLLSFFAQRTDAKAKGIAKKLSSEDFIRATHYLMDIIPTITKLSLLFQKKELDIAIVPLQIENTINDLKVAKDSTGPHEEKLKADLKLVNGKLTFKDHVITKSKKPDESTPKKAFVDNLVQNLQNRFPSDSKSLLNAFGALSMRPITFLSNTELMQWGNDHLNTLIQHYGFEKSRGDETMGSIIDPEVTRDEWQNLKLLVKAQGYPRDNMRTLWALINKFHRENFPNLIKLAALGLTTPCHTSDCERGSSVQNQIKVAKRNRLSSNRLDDLSLIAIEGPTVKEFSLLGNEALKIWKDQKRRKIFIASTSCATSS